MGSRIRKAEARRWDEQWPRGSSATSDDGPFHEVPSGPVLKSDSVFPFSHLWARDLIARSLPSATQFIEPVENDVDLRGPGARVAVHHEEVLTVG